MNEWEWNLLEDKTPVASPARRTTSSCKPGDRVRLRPRPGGDVMDLALAGKTATIEAIEQDYDGQIHLAVVVDDDPGRDLGLARQPGHRFFFARGSRAARGGDPTRPPPNRPILIAGIGNIFFGDDAFGVEVAQRLGSRPLPSGRPVVDFGIRGFDLACALLDGPDVAILVDACPRGDGAGHAARDRTGSHDARRASDADSRRSTRTGSIRSTFSGSRRRWAVGSSRDPGGRLRAGDARRRRRAMGLSDAGRRGGRRDPAHRIAGRSRRSPDVNRSSTDTSGAHVQGEVTMDKTSDRQQSD